MRFIEATSFFIQSIIWDWPFFCCAERLNDIMKISEWFDSLMMFLFFEEKWEWYSFLAILFHRNINMILTSFLRKSLESYPFFWDPLSYWINYIILTLISYKNRRWDSMRRFLFYSINHMRLTFFLLCRTLEWYNEDLWITWFINDVLVLQREMRMIFVLGNLIS